MASVNRFRSCACKPWASHRSAALRFPGFGSSEWYLYRAISVRAEDAVPFASAALRTAPVTPAPTDSPRSPEVGSGGFSFKRNQFRGLSRETNPALDPDCPRASAAGAAFGVGFFVAVPTTSEGRWPESNRTSRAG